MPTPAARTEAIAGRRPALSAWGWPLLLTGIDRRFYRRKYDAARTLAAFGAHARDETDLACLSGRLTDVVGETMRPERVSLWLKQ